MGQTAVPGHGVRVAAEQPQHRVRVACGCVLDRTRPLAHRRVSCRTGCHNGTAQLQFCGVCSSVHCRMTVAPCVHYDPPAGMTPRGFLGRPGCCRRASLTPGPVQNARFTGITVKMVSRTTTRRALRSGSTPTTINRHCHRHRPPRACAPPPPPPHPKAGTQSTRKATVNKTCSSQTCRLQ